MATLYFSRDGKAPDRAKDMGELSIEIITTFFKGQNHYYFANPPGINPDKEPSPVSDHTNVVVEITDEETNETFTQPGYYWFAHVDPCDCAPLLPLAKKPVCTW